MINTNYEQLYIKGEKSGTKSIILSSLSNITASYEQYTDNLTGTVSVNIRNNGTKKVTIDFTWYNLYINGETWDGYVTAKDKDDNINIPVVINCSDTLIYSDVRHEIDVLNGIHINYNSIPEVNNVYLTTKDNTKINIDYLLKNQSINLTYNDVLNEFGIIDFDYITATNQLSKISHKLQQSVYELESLSVTSAVIDYKERALVFRFKSLRSGKPYEPNITISNYGTYKLVLLGDVYYLYVDISENTGTTDRMIYIRVQQPESHLTLNYNISQKYDTTKPLTYPIYVYKNNGNGYVIVAVYRSRICYGIDGYSYNSIFRIADIEASLVSQRGNSYIETPISLEVYQGEGDFDYYIYWTNDETVKLKLNINPLYSPEASTGFFHTIQNPYGLLFAGTDLQRVDGNIQLPTIDSSWWDRYTSPSGYNKGKVTYTNMFMESRIENAPVIKYLGEFDKETGYARAFHGCTELKDISNLHNIVTNETKNISYIFYDCFNLNDISPLAYWDTSNVKDMSCVFYGCASLSDISPLTNWNTSNVTNMEHTFHDCFDLSDISPLTNWNTSNVTNMGGMFYDCSLSDISPLTNWNTSNVTYMHSMFFACRFQYIWSLSNWNTSNVTDMRYMFEFCTNLQDISPLAYWDTSNLIHMDAMFRGCVSITDFLPLAFWITSNVARLYKTFEGCTRLQEASFIDFWDTSNVYDMSFLFNDCSNLISVPAIDCSSVFYFDFAFSGCTNLQNLGGFKGLRARVNLTACTKLTKQSLLNVFDTIADVTGITNTPELRLGPTNILKLTSDELKIATSKGWILN